MRICDFQAENVLYFPHFHVDFGPASQGLHIFYGPNEAGKSTLLNLIVDWMFGGRIAEAFLPAYGSHSYLQGTLEALEAAPDDFQAFREISATTGSKRNVSPQPALRVVRRARKGKKLVLQADGEESLSEESLQQFLGGIDRDGYELLFGFNHQRLRQGGESLLSSGGHAGISLFEAGGGVQFLRNLSQTLETRAGELLDSSFRTNSNKALNKAWREYRSLLEDSRKSRLRSEAWHRLQAEIQRTDAMLEKLKERQKTLTQRQSALNRIQHIRPLVEDWKQTEKQLEDLQEALELPEGLDEEIPETLVSLQDTEREWDRLKKDEARVAKQLEDIPQDTAVLAVAAKIQELQQRLQQYRDALSELPSIALQIKNERQRGELLLKGFDPAVSLDQVEQFRMPYDAEETARQLAEQWNDLKRSSEDLEMVIQEQTADLEGVEQQLKRLGEAMDLSVLNKIIGELSAAGDLDKAVNQAESKLDSSKAHVGELLKKQSLFSGSAETLCALPIPMEKTLERYAKNFGESDETITRCRKEIEEIQKDLKRIAGSLETLALGGPVPVEADLTLSRQVRDKGWTLIKRVWLEEESINAPSFHEELAGYTKDEPLHSVFEKALQRSDEIVDRMRLDSERSARRSQLLLEQQRQEERLQEQTASLESAVQRRRELDLDWKAQWKDTGIRPKLPVEMQEWVYQFYRTVTNDMQGIRVQEQELRLLKKVYGQFTVRLQETLGQEAEDKTSLATLRTLAEARREKERTRENRRMTLTEKRDDVQTKIRNSTGKRQSVQWQLEQVEEEFSKLRKQHLFLPEKIRVLRLYLDKLQDVFTWVKELRRIEAEQAKRRQTCLRFEQDAEKLVQSLETKIAQGQTYDDYMQKAILRLAQAGKWESHREELAKELSRIREDSAKVLAKVEQLRKTVEQYKEHCQCSATPQLQRIVEKSIGKKKLTRELAETEQKLRKSGNGLAVADLIREAEEGPGVDMLPTELQSLADELAQLNGDVESHTQERGRLALQFQEMNESRADAADFLQQAEFQMTQVDRYWNEYLRFELARRLLNLAVEKFRERNQGSVIEAAGDIFRRLTLGRYVELTVEYDGDTPVLEAVTSDAQRRRVGQMSDGTRDELYLALRLAFVSRHLAGAEPIPLVMDDILVNFDDERTAATLEVLQEFAGKTQILYFTHHQSVVDAAKQLSRRAHNSGVLIHELREMQE